MKILNKYILVVSGIVLLVFISSCGNRTITTIEKDIRRIDIINHKGYLAKTYYEKYSKNYSGWLKAYCDKKEAIVENLFSNKLNCKITPSSLNLINNSISSNEIQIASKNLNNNNQQEESQQEESQQEESQQEESQQEETQEEEEQEEENTLPINPPIEECNDPTIC